MTATPRDLDPNFKPTDTNEIPMIVHREIYLENGVQHERLHRVPLAEWSAYEKEKGL